MAVSPDDRFAGLINSSAERGGWVPGDVFTADTAGEEEPVEPRRVRLPVLVAVAIATLGVLVLAFFLFRPVPHEATGAAGEAGQQVGSSEQSADEAGAAAKATAGAEAGGSASATASGEVIVHVTGAVRTPSVVTLVAGARVQDAVEAAGGLKGDAAADSINLARVLTDGEQIHIPEEGEDPGADAQGTDAQGAGAQGSAAQGSGGTGEAGAAAQGSTGADSAASGSAAGNEGPGQGAAGPSGKIDLNTADATALQTLPGVGPVTAEAIISHRQSQPFAAVDDLLLVKGIGPKTFESLRDLVTVG